MKTLLTSKPHQVFVPTVEAPRFYRGYRAGLAASLALSAWLPVVMWFTRRQERHEKTRNPQQAGCEAETTVINASRASPERGDQDEKAA